MNLSYSSKGDVVVTLAKSGSVNKGDCVKITDNCTAGPCSDSDTISGMAVNVQGDYVAVQLSGIVTFTSEEELPLGYCRVVANASGGISPTENTGRFVTVLNYDSTDGTVTVCL